MQSSDISYRTKQKQRETEKKLWEHPLNNFRVIPLKTKNSRTKRLKARNLNVTAEFSQVECRIIRCRNITTLQTFV